MNPDFELDNTDIAGVQYDSSGLGYDSVWGCCDSGSQISLSTKGLTVFTYLATVCRDINNKCS